jgi:protein-S-isoprenylcysteine O-methyltransferase Ste14
MWPWFHPGWLLLIVPFLNMSAISSSEKPAERPRAISASRSSTPGSNARCRPRLPIEAIRPFSVGIAMNKVRPLPFRPSTVAMLGPLATVCAVLLFLLSYREFRRAGTPVRGSERSTTIVRTGPYRFSRNPIYLSFILLVLGLSVWLNDLWLLVTLIPAVGIIAMVVIPREEGFLERNFNDQYSSYKAQVRRWL